MNILPDTKIDWLKYRWYFFFLSLTVLVVCGFAAQRSGGLRYGIDFSEGTIVYAKFRTAPPIEAIRDALSDAGIHGVVLQRFDREELNQLMIRVGHERQRGDELSATADNIVSRLRDVAGDDLLDTSTEVVGPVVGQELRDKARNAIFFALVAMLVYIALRFEPIYGVAATVALAHDVFVTLGILALSGYEITLHVVAAFLTLVGYSVNDTIVVFDRVRENRRMMRQRSLYDVINLSINQTLRRTILTSGLTFLAVLPLYLLGGEALRPFAFVMLVGIVTGTYSTLGIASPVVSWWKGRRKIEKRVSSRPSTAAVPRI